MKESEITHRMFLKIWIYDENTSRSKDKKSKYTFRYVSAKKYKIRLKFENSGEIFG